MTRDGVWWLTVVDFDAACSRCRRVTPAGEHVVYSHAERRSICTRCFDILGLAAAPSRRLLQREGSWRRWRRRR